MMAEQILDNINLWTCRLYQKVSMQLVAQQCECQCNVLAADAWQMHLAIATEIDIERDLSIEAGRMDCDVLHSLKSYTRTCLNY